MKAPGATTILQLVLLGLGLVALPLLGGLVVAMLEVEELARHSRVAVFASGYAVQTSRSLLEQAEDLQRAGQQFLVLGDEEIRARYLARQATFRSTVDQFDRLDLDDTQRTLLSELVAREAALFTSLERHREASKSSSPALDDSPTLAGTARTLFFTNTRLLIDQAESLRDRAEHAEQLMLWAAAGLMPATLLFAVVLVRLIARPLGQIDAAVHRLGRGIVDEPITVNGPRDLEVLGENLDLLRRRLVDLEAQKVNFLRQFSHELKTPLTAIREGAELLADAVLGPLGEEQQEVASIVKSKSLRLQSLLEDLLRFSVENPFELTLRHEDIPVDELIRGVLADQKLVMAAKRLEVHLDLGATRCHGDAEKIRIVLENLLVNAVKFAPSGTTISVRTGATDTTVSIDVIDAGPGILPSERERVFEPFYQGSAVDDGYVSGTGLGLAIVKEYVGLHGGEVEALDSRVGAHLRVSLPVPSGQ